MRYIIAVLAVAGIVVSCLALAATLWRSSRANRSHTLGLELRIR